MKPPRLISVKANLRDAQVKADAMSAGRSQNEARTRQAIRGIKDMFKKDGLIK
ncbi:MAG: hypothetical protein ACREUW_14075 [Burkholderiales bacterium]